MVLSLSNSTVFVADNSKTSHVFEGVKEIVVEIIDIALKSWS